ncbi:MAG: exodeoxyribonuclease VII small subunit [Pseudomonadota bacterium]|nr:exodeoxyribonuclease VII small subunit [Pseudomonadota bacterium]|tara:strand:- start:582 stop:785 length:204 start_codon:yes stop_codon:yes gene_type:complete
MTKKSNNINTFENDLKKLQEILEQIESDELSLEESITKYKEGVVLSKKCQKALEDAKQIIKVLDDEK